MKIKSHENPQLCGILIMHVHVHVHVHTRMYKARREEISQSQLGFAQVTHVRTCTRTCPIYEMRN